MDAPSIELSPRTVTGKKVKTLRRQGVVPVHVYGWEVAPQALQVEAQVLRRILPQVGTNVPLSLEIDGQKGENICFVREVQRHPVTEDVLHVDFMRVNISRTIRSEVPIVLLGNAPAIRELSGVLLQPLQNLLVESLPMNVPASIEADISDLDDFEKAIYVRDLTLDESVTVVTDPEEMIARVSPPRVEVVEEEEEELEEGEEGEEAAEEGEAPTAEAAPTEVESGD